MEKLLNAALEYAELDWSVHPLHNVNSDGSCTCGESDCDSPGKHPRLGKWQFKVSTDKKTIQTWWRRWPNANIGVACRPSGLLVIDQDVKNGINGMETWAAVQEKFGFNDLGALKQFTPSGGQHSLFRIPDGMDMSAVKDSPPFNDYGGGVDIRYNGYFCAYPSVTDVGEYLWEVSSHPSDNIPSPVPIELPSLLVNGRPQKKSKRITKGERNERLFRAACHARGKGSTEEEILALLENANEKRCDPPLKQSELEVIASSAAGYTPEVAGASGFFAGLDGDKTQGKRLETSEYSELYKSWGYDIKLNLCDDSLEVNGVVITDVERDSISAQIRDHGITTGDKVSIPHAMEALTVTGKEKSYHPIKEYLESLTWGGKDTIAWLGAHVTDKEDVFTKWLRHWLVGAVAKIYGDHQNPMLVLDGPQNIGKSYLARWLCPLPRFFNGSAIMPENKDHRLRLLRCWIWEAEELGTTTRKADAEALKAFLTLATVRERKPYGHYEVVKPSLSSFIGTINNQSGFLTDRSGNRRFLTCTIEHIDWKYSTEIDVGQIWSQALHIYRDNDDWKLTRDDREERDTLNENYKVDDPVEIALEKILTFTGSSVNFVETESILARLRTMGYQINRGTTMTISAVLGGWGAESSRPRIDGVKQRGYKKVRLML